MKKKNKIRINGILYVRADSVEKIEEEKTEKSVPAQKLDNLEYCIVRTYSAGVFAGYVKERKGQEATVLQARRLWYWDGAASLSQLAVDGVSKPQNCKFPVEVERVELTNVIEVIPCTEKAKGSIANVKIWSS